MSETPELNNTEPHILESNLCSDTPQVNPEPRIDLVSNRVKIIGSTALNGVRSAVALFNMSPANDALKYAELLTIEGITHSPLISAAAYAATTVGIESSSAYIAAPLFSLESSDKIKSALSENLGKLVDRLSKFPRIRSVVSALVNDEGGVKFGTFSRGLAAIYGGTVLSMALRNAENPKASVETNRKYGAKTSLWLGGVCLVEGGILAEGANASIDNPKIAIPLITLGASAYFGNKFRIRFSADNKTERRYDLSIEEMETLESELVQKARKANMDGGIVAVWINPKSKYANFVRMHESQYFPEVADVKESDDDDILFLALIDTRDGVNKVIHGAQMTGLSYIPTKRLFKKQDNKQDSTGLYTLDSLISLGNFTYYELNEYYAKIGVDVSKSIAVETNFRIENADKYQGLTPAEIAYLMSFRLVKRTSGKLTNKARFASINRASKISFKRFGLEFQTVMNRAEFITEESMLGKETLPIAVTYTQEVKSLMEVVDANIKIPEIFI